jgi:hypothetical protein
VRGSRFLVTLTALPGLYRPLWVLGLFVAVLLVYGGSLLAGEGAQSPQPAQILETDITPHSRPMTFSQLLDEYLAMLQERLKHETTSLRESALVEVKLTIRKDGSLTFREIVVLNGPANLRNELLPLVERIEPLPPPPVDADMLDVSILLPLQYPSPDLLDSIDEEN